MMVKVINRRQRSPLARKELEVGPFENCATHSLGDIVQRWDFDKASDKTLVMD